MNIDVKEVIETVKTTLTTKYFCFNGRTDKKTFWMYFIPVFVLLFVLRFIPFGSVVGLLLILPTFGITARRLHDVGVSGWIQLLLIFDLYGYLPILYLCWKETVNEGNRFAEVLPATETTQA